MSHEDVEFALPNLVALRDALSQDTEALELLFAFDAESLPSARQALRLVVADWARPIDQAGHVTVPDGEVSR